MDAAKDMIPEYPTKMTKFSNLRNITLYFPSNFGADATQISYIGLKGEWTAVIQFDLGKQGSDHHSL